MDREGREVSEMGTNRWPKSLHSQAEALLGGIRAIGRKKGSVDRRCIRGVGTWDVYRSDIHRFVEFLQRAALRDLRQARRVSGFVRAYIADRGQALRDAGGSFQTIEREISALAKLSHALDVYAERHGGESAEGIRSVLAEEKTHWRTELAARSGGYTTRAYPDPAGLYAAIPDSGLRLQARLMGETGCRAEGIGAPARGSNPLTAANLLGMGTDPVSGASVGRIIVTEKGGKHTEHFLKPETYHELEAHIERHGQLASPYRTFLRAVEAAARTTGQYAPGRGTHGLKHSFAQTRMNEAIDAGLSHEEAKQTVANEIAHNRLDSVDIYMR
jgi:integrase